MAMSDCIRCWDTPCSCGYDYRRDSREKRAEHAAVVLGVEKNSPEFKALLSPTPENHPMKDMA